MEFSSLLWSIPFLGIIFSMALLPLLCEKSWHKYGLYVLAFWPAVYLLLIAYVFGFSKVFDATFEPIFAHFLPFIILISSLYTISGGIYLDFPRGYGPLFNVCFLFFGSLLAGWIGTTGAATLLIRPLLRANSGRKHQTHILLFFLFLIANIGGAATPLGDPPLLIGFLEGVNFFWFFKNLYPFFLSVIAALCVLFFIIDTILFKIDPAICKEKTDRPLFIIRGATNLYFIAFILIAVIFCNFEGEFTLFNEKFTYSSLIRNIAIVIFALVSMKITPRSIREKNYFSFEPVKEVAELFAGIFITVTPIIHILHQGLNGELKFIFDWIAPDGQFDASKCFWACGLLSAFLDNAPTFLIFFHLTSGDAIELMTTKANILTAISVATVFMGALTYIGNAPNLMVKSIYSNYGLKPPSFFGYMAWSMLILVPMFLIIARYF